MAWKQITRVEITNFQSHKHTVIEPTPGVTVIVGHSDSGKSAFIRAIKWCLYNKQPKSPLINKDAKYAEVTVTFSDGTSITRHKSDKENMYQIVSADGEQKVFTSVGANPLKEVMDATGMHEIDIFNKNLSLNMVEQFDNLFFLAENSTDRGTLISQMANTEVCDTAIAICSTEINSLKKTITKTAKKVKSDKEELSKYAYVDELKEVIDSLIKAKEHVLSIDETVSSIDKEVAIQRELSKRIGIDIGKLPSIEDVNNCLGQIESVKNNSDKYSHLANSCGVVERYLPLFKKYSGLLQNISLDDIENLKDNLEIVSIICDKADVIKSANKLLLEKSATLSKSAMLSREDIDNALLKLEDVRKSFNTATAIGIFSTSIMQNGSRKLSYDNNIRELETKRQEKIDAYKQMLKESEICPVCGSVMDEEHISHAGEVI